jgi:hypothetical protein
MKPSEMIQAAIDSGIYKSSLYMCNAVKNLPGARYLDVCDCQMAITKRIYPFATLPAYIAHRDGMKGYPNYQQRVEFWLEFIEELKKQNR